MTILAWHFTAKRLRDGRPIPTIGVRLEHDGPLKLCVEGLHASVRVIDALTYAPGPLLHRVECGGEMIESDDKLVCRERTILWSVDATHVLRQWTRWCALQVVDLWNAPDVVRRYLETGDEDLRDAASDAAWDAARDAARAAAWAARDATRAAARGAVWAARAAARGARDATRDAARDATRDAQNTELTRLAEEARP